MTGGVFVLGNGLLGLAAVVAVVIVWACCEWIRERDKRGER